MCLRLNHEFLVTDCWGGLRRRGWEGSVFLSELVGGGRGHQSGSGRGHAGFCLRWGVYGMSGTVWRQRTDKCAVLDMWV